ncbi:hypothetical protein vseg_010757 [Gypsophila vaccaria]
MGRKNIINKNFSMEVAPSPILYPRKPSLRPGLEPIREENTEGCEEGSNFYDSFDRISLKWHG